MEALLASGIDAIDTNNVKYFDERTYQSGAYRKDSTDWDRAYSELVSRVRQFGFTHAHREQLDTIAVHMEHLAEQHPTPFRQAQARIVQIHQQMWDSRPWRRLADALRDNVFISGGSFNCPSLHDLHISLLTMRASPSSYRVKRRPITTC